MTTSPARIAIIGTGPGGLTCARILHQAGIDNTAMLDGADLATAIIEATGVTEAGVTAALAAYEAIMPRAARNAAGAHEGLTSAITAHPDFDHDPHADDSGGAPDGATAQGTPLTSRAEN